ncbi:MAG: hypothetical protein ACRECG_02905 [Bradyrhizobium sp.]|jgi:hypothetical protein
MPDVNLKISADHDEMTFSLLRPSGTVASIVISTEAAAQIAGNVLEAAKAAYDATGKPPPDDSNEVSLKIVRPSGYNVVPGQKATLTMIHFHFGETTLGIEVRNEDAEILGRRLMTTAAEGNAQ